MQLARIAGKRVAQQEIASGMTEDSVSNTPLLLTGAGRCPLYFARTTSTAPNRLGKGLRRRHARWPRHTWDPRPGPSLSASARGILSADGESLPDSGVAGACAPQTGSYFQHEVVFRGRGRGHLPQRPLALQRNRVDGGQQGRHDLWELEGEEEGPVTPGAGQTGGERGVPTAHPHPQGNPLSFPPGIIGLARHPDTSGGFSSPSQHV